MQTVGDVIEGATEIALLIFAFFVAVSILAAGSIDVVVQRFARFVTAMALTLAPTSPVAIIIAFISTLAAGLSASKVPGPILMKVGVAIVVWQLLSLTLNYFTAPI